MVKVDIKGINPASSKGRKYYYAWRGRGAPRLVMLYKASTAYTSLQQSTKDNWARWLDRIGDYFGELRIAQFDRLEKIRPIIRQWRAQYAATPRYADTGMQVLSRVLSYAVEEGKITSNPCEGIKALYSSDRSEIIWTATDIATLKATCSAEIAHAVDLDSHTGLRLGDLLRLSWSHVGDDAIVIMTGKSKHRRPATIPLYDDLRAVLAAIPKRSTTILTNSKGRPWTRDGFGSSFNKAKIAAGMADADLHFHDLRGTAATRFYVANLSERAIAGIMGWEEEHVAKIIRRYVDRSAAIRAIIRQLNERRT
jgi:integrase